MSILPTHKVAVGHSERFASKRTVLERYDDGVGGSPHVARYRAVAKRLRRLRRRTAAIGGMAGRSR